MGMDHGRNGVNVRIKSSWKTKIPRISSSSSRGMMQRTVVVVDIIVIVVVVIISSRRVAVRMTPSIVTTGRH